MNDLSVHTLCNLPASVKRLPFCKGAARHWHVKRSRFSDVIDESPDLTDAAYNIIRYVKERLFDGANVSRNAFPCKYYQK